MRRAIPPRVCVGLLTLIGLAARLCIVRGFWLDEATSGYDARQSFATMLHLLTNDNHPPLDYAMLWAVAHTVGSTPDDLRAPSIVLGTLLVPMLYVAGRTLYDEWVGVLAAAMGAVGALAIWYAQEARMYTLFVLLATVLIWSQARILQTGRNRYWAIWAATAAAMVWTQWFTTLAIGTQVLVFVWVILSQRRGGEARVALRRLVVAVGAIAVLVAPIVPLLLTQFHNNQANGLGIGSSSATTNTVTSGAGASVYGFFDNIVWALFGYHSNGTTALAVAVWPLALLLVLVLLGRGRTRANGILAAQVVVPMAIVFCLSVDAAPGRSLFEIRYFIEAVPALYLLVAGAVRRLTPTVRTRRALTAVLLGAMAVATVLQQTDSANPRLYGYQAAFDQISSVAKPGAEILYAPSYINVDVAYFEPHVRAEAATTNPPALPAADQVFVVGSFPFAGTETSRSATSQLVRALASTRHLAAVLEAPNVTVWEFT